MKLNLETIDPIWHEQVRTAIDENDAEGCVLFANSAALAFVFDNAYLLKARSMYEKCLVSAYIGCKHNFSHWDTCALSRLFNLADKEEMQGLGDLLPSAGPLIVYRGVSGNARHRRVRGWSWALDFDVACWFALREGLERPSVYSAVIETDEVYYYSNDRQEEEIIARPAHYRRVKTTPKEMAARQARKINRSHGNDFQIQGQLGSAL